MAIFPYAELEEIVQVDDKTRLDARKSFVSKDEAAVTLVQIIPEVAGSVIDVTGSSYKDWYLDWEYSTDGVKSVEIRVTTDGVPTSIFRDITVITEVDDLLFSTDSNIRLFENDILKWVEKGRNTFKNMHRNAQTLMLDWLYRMGYTDAEGNKLTKAAVIDLDELSLWSSYEALALIFFDQSSTPEDFFYKKAKDYEDLVVDVRSRAILKLDTTGDGVENNLDVSTIRVNRV